MSDHLPTVILQADVFPDDRGVDDREIDATPEEVAVMAWEDICSWVANGYLPVVEVFMPDGTQHTIDIERVRKQR